MKKHNCPRCNGTGQIYDKTTTGAQLRIKREAAGISLRKIAELLDLSPSYLCRLETGFSDVPTGTIDRYLAIVKGGGK